MRKLVLHPHRLFPSEPGSREIASRLYAEIKDLPIISPHGHTDPAWFADDLPFGNAADLLIKPDHYVFRMLYSLGCSLESLGVPFADGRAQERDPWDIWNLFAKNYHVFRGTPTRMWMDYIFKELFEFEMQLSEDTARDYYDHINAQLKTDAFRPRSLFERFNIECLATTESPLDDLQQHKKIQDSPWEGRVITAFRPDPVVDPEFEGYRENVQYLGEITGENTEDYDSYLKALRLRREYFKGFGATSTDHGHPSAFTADLDRQTAKKLFSKTLSAECSAEDAELFRGQMLTEMARMSLDDGLTMQIHPGSHRNHNPQVFSRFGRDKGADIPMQTEYVNGLKPLLNKYGNENNLTIILFTLDETVYSRELAPLAGHYPALKLGPSWWFHDSPEGMRRFREQVTETAGFYNTVGFNDDTRAFLSIPARHDLARRMDCNFLSRLVAEHRMEEDEALEVALQLSYKLVKKAYKLD